MLNQDEQIALFVEAINKNAQKICKKIDKETKRFYQSEIEKIQSNAEKQMLQRINRSENEIETDFNKSLSLNKAKNRQLLCDKRQAIAESVFAEAEKQIIAFTQSEDYVALIEKSLKEIYLYIRGDMEIFARSADTEKVESAVKNTGLVCEVRTDDTILLGGIKVKSQTLGKIFDDTLDQRLQEQREWFFSNSRLQINL